MQYDVEMWQVSFQLLNNGVNKSVKITSKNSPYMVYSIIWMRDNITWLFWYARVTRAVKLSLEIYHIDDSEVVNVLI